MNSPKSAFELYEDRFNQRRAKEGQHVDFTPPKKAIYEFFEGKISKRAIRKWDDQFCVIGKTCIINLEPDRIIDIWICNPQDFYNGIGQKAVNNRLRAFKSPNTIVVKELDREGWVKTRDKELILRNLSLLGIKKTKNLSEATLQKLQENLRKPSEERTDG